VTTEITDEDAGKARGWIFYDADCSFCVQGVKRWGGLFARRGFVWLPLQTPGATARLGVTEEDLLAEMHLLLPGRRIRRGVDAWATALRTVWWLWPLGALLAVPGFRDLGRAGYRSLARNRYCLGQNCEWSRHRKSRLRAVDWWIALAWPVAVAASTWRAAAWMFMWALAVAIGIAGKWLVWQDTRHGGIHTRTGRTLAWFFAWPGLDGKAFFLCQHASPKPDSREWLFAWGKLSLGIGLIWLPALLARPLPPLLAGWLGMLGIIFCLHFGGFHLLSLLWRRAGVPAAPIMRTPWRAVSLAEFWGERWNTAFSIPARRLMLLPLARRVGLNRATFAVFLLSGLLHESVISLPARGGFGLPTAYFLLQNLGVVLERSDAGRRLGLGRGWRGWTFTFLFTAAPVFWLFHPAFVHNVILPMLDAVGAR
jgi:predicted DCC family thiol-disulfide oxidoreductase YuxK